MYSEMLGNKYFLARNYNLAALNFQETLKSDPINKAIRKKLIICYTQIGQIKKAFDIFYLLAKEDIDFIIETDLVADDCPCEELTEKYGNILPYENESVDLKLMLAMLWLYCSTQKSLKFFKQLITEIPGDKRIQELTLLIENKIVSNNKTQTH